MGCPRTGPGRALAGSSGQLARTAGRAVPGGQQPRRRSPAGSNRAAALPAGSNPAEGARR